MKKEFRVKKRISFYYLKASLILASLLAAVFCSLITLVLSLEPPFSVVITVFGILCAVYFSFLFVTILIKGVKPRDALIFTEDGIFNFVNEPVKGIFIKWSEISSVKVIGSQKDAMLGIELYDWEIFSKDMKKYLQEQMEANIEDGLPALIISQSALSFDLSQIMPVANNLMMSARGIKNVRNIKDEEKKSKSPVKTPPVAPPSRKTAPVSEKRENPKPPVIPNIVSAPKNHEPVYYENTDEQDEEVTEQKIRELSEALEALKNQKAIKTTRKPAPAIMPEEEEILEEKEEAEELVEEKTAEEEIAPDKPLKAEEKPKKEKKDPVSLEDLLETFNIPLGE